uniref:ENTH domain-containing protein n=1 Tax=Poecilia mexicana TaxID=48701 RepID=A0A3B3XK38_9TELE
DENGKDQGVNVRQKVKELIEFVQDDDRLREERKKAKKNKDKYVGVSSDSMGFRAGDRYDSSGESRAKWDDDWEKNKGPFPFSEKLGEISDKIGSTIDDTISRFRKKDRDDSPDRFRYKKSKREFKDEEETVTTKSVQIVQATETTATRKRGVPSRKVDLGAAAHYTGDQSSAPIINDHLVGKNQTYCFSHVSAAAVSSPNGDFGEWNAFPGGQIPASAQSPENSGSDLFGAMATASPTAPTPVAAAAPAPASADLFDLMGPSQTLTSSQSLNFSMSSTQTMSTNIMPQPVSQVSSLPSTWSDHSVNISLDFLGPGMQPPKPSQPSLNTLQQGHQPAPNMLTQGFSSMNLGPTPVRPPANAMMQPGAGMGMGMGMVPNQGMMGMGMNMGMPQGGMTMGMPGGMGMGMGMHPAMVQQPKHDAFADFGNFGK